FNSGRYLSDGTTLNQESNNSIFIGSYSRSGASGSTNEIAIGDGATGLGSNSVVLGNNSTATTAIKGKVGIGTTAPTDQLHVDGDLRITGALKDANNAAGTMGQLLMSTASGSEWTTLLTSVSVGTVSTSLTAGSTPTVTDSGTAQAVVLDFDFPAPIVKGTQATDGTNSAFTITNSGITPTSVVTVSYYDLSNSNEIITHAITGLAAGSFTVQFAATPPSGGEISYTVVN
ncbi:MAG: hypothetical protein ACPIB5_00845, partial [Flavobacteriaceae bacterium]